jgi:hypothetical protein
MGGVKDSMTEEEKREKKRAYDRVYRANNRERIAATKKKYQEENSERLKQKNKDDYQKNKSIRSEKNKEYYLKNRDKIIKRQRAYHERKIQEDPEGLRKARKKYYIQNKEDIRGRAKKFYQKNKSKILSKNRKYCAENKEKISKQRRSKRAKNLNFHLACNLRSRISCILGKIKAKKSCGTFDLLGCSISELKKHLESQFQDGMSWENYGKDGWHVDHIKPCASFDLSKKVDQKKCFHYTNLQPLWWEDNLSKGSSYGDERFFYNKL